MSTYPNLRAALAAHRFDDSSSAGDEIFCHESDDSPQVGLMRGPDCQADWEEWVDHFADAWMTACTITTVDELDALPSDSVVITPTSAITYQKARGSLNVWYSSALSTNSSGDIGLPALLVWSPEWQKP